MESWKVGVVVAAATLAGVALGAWLFGDTRAEAQAGPYTMCFIARQESLDTNRSGQVQRMDDAHSIRVPAGYEPVGGGGLMGNWLGAIVFCRR